MVTHDDILQIANLAKLSVQEDELDALTKDMGEIIEFANTINNAADDGEAFDNINNLSNVLRDDEVVPSLSVDEILENANDSENDHFLVKKRVL